MHSVQRTDPCEPAARRVNQAQTHAWALAACPAAQANLPARAPARTATQVFLHQLLQVAELLNEAFQVCELLSVVQRKESDERPLRVAGQNRKRCCGAPAFDEDFIRLAS